MWHFSCFPETTAAKGAVLRGASGKETSDESQNFSLAWSARALFHDDGGGWRPRRLPGQLLRRGAEVLQGGLPLRDVHLQPGFMYVGLLVSDFLSGLTDPASRP